MTSGQAFYILLVGLYLIAGFINGSRNAIVVRKKFLKKGWSLGHPFAFLGGLNKSLIFSHICPIYSYTIVINPEDRKSSKIIPTRHTKNIVNIIAHAASRLRFFTFIIFYLYFLAIPMAYNIHGDMPITYLFILGTLICSLIPIFYFFFLHKKLAPLERDVRWKNICYAIFMPWHVMRLADFLFNNPHLRAIHPLSYTALCSGATSRDYLSQQYRNTQHLSKSLYTEQEFEELFQRTNFKAADFTSPPKPEDSSEEQYCPCCHSLFTSQTTHCDECQNITLIRFTKSTP